MSNIIELLSSVSFTYKNCTFYRHRLIKERGYGERTVAKTGEATD